VWIATRVGPSGFTVPVALKTLNESSAGSQEQVRAFTREARAASCIQHRNVVPTRELIFDRGHYWIGMDLVRGWSVRGLLSATGASRERIPIPMALSLARDAAAGLQAIHDAGLVHCNVTPENLMVSSAGQLQVLDFGCATWQRDERIRFTPPIDLIDPMYSSPDLRARLPIDARTDVFSLGVLLDQMIPHRGDAPVALDAIIRRAIDPDTGRRFQSARALEVALDLVSIREGWLVTPSYVAAYLGDVFRAGGLATPQPQTAARAATGDDPDAAAEPEPVSSSRRVLPRGRRGMVGVGATLPSARVQHGLPAAPPPRNEEQHVARISLAPRPTTSLTQTRVRVRR